MHRGGDIVRIADVVVDVVGAALEKKGKRNIEITHFILANAYINTDHHGLNPIKPANGPTDLPTNKTKTKIHTHTYNKTQMAGAKTIHKKKKKRIKVYLTNQRMYGPTDGRTDRQSGLYSCVAQN